MSLLEQYRQGSRYHSQGRFTLDESRARNKMARFQLSRSEEYLLLLVQAMVARQCSGVEISIEDRVIRFAASGVDLEAEKLERLDDFLFDTSLKMAAYHLIGVAFNAVGELAAEGPEMDFREGMFTFELSTQKSLPNLPAMLEERLAYLPVPWVLNGVERPPAAVGDESPVRILDSGVSQVTLVRFGVIVDTKHLTDKVSFSAVAVEDRLTLDASYSHVVENKVYEKLIAKLRAQALECLAERVRQHPGGEPESARLRRYLHLGVGGPAAKALREGKLYPLADREEYASWQELEEQRQEFKKVLFSRRKFRIRMDQLVVLCDVSSIEKSLENMFGASSLADAEGTYRQQLQAQKNRERWEKSPPRELMLPPGEYALDTEISGKGWRAQIGVLKSTPAPARLDIWYQSKPLNSEDMSGVPPGSVAVVDFDEVELTLDWSRATGRIYRSALRSIQGDLNRLFAQAEFEQIPKGSVLEQYLWELASQRKSPAPVALKAPLLKSVGRRPVSRLEEISSEEQVALIHPDGLSENFPLETLPDVVFRHSPILEQRLRRALGAKRVVDLRPLQAQIETVASEIREPSLLRTPSIGKLWLDRTLEGPNWRARFAFGPSLEPRVLVVHFTRGRADLERVKQRCLKVVGAQVQVVSPRFEIRSDWNGIERDDLFKECLSWLEKRALELEEQLVGEVRVPLGLRQEILLGSPARFQEVRTVPLFTTASRGGTLVDLETVHRELETHGSLLRGPEGYSVKGRTVLLSSADKNERKLLVSMLGREPEWLAADRLAELRQLKDDFLRQPQLQEILYQGQALWRQPLSVAQGEVVLGAFATPTVAKQMVSLAKTKITDLISGRVEAPEVEAPGIDRAVALYCEGRLVIHRTRLLPPGCQAAVQSNHFQLNESFSDVEVSDEHWDEILQEIQVLIERGLLDLLQAESRFERGFAWGTLERYPLTEEARGKILSLPVIPRQGEGFLSLKELTEGEKSFRYVLETEISKRLKTSRLVARVPESWLRGMLKVTGLPGNSVAKLLEKEQEVEFARQSMPGVLPEGLFNRVFEEDGKRAEIGLNRESVSVSLDRQGKPSFRFEWRGLPAFLLVSGYRVTPGRGDPAAHGQMAKKDLNQLERWVAEVYLEWVNDLEKGSFREAERRWMLEILDLLKAEISRKRSTPEARLAQKLWALPLFLRVDGTRQCGDSLLVAFRELKKPLLLTETSRGAPGEVLLVEEESPEFKILRSLVGRKGIQWFEAAPLVDPTQVQDSALNLLRWGLAPIGFATKTFAAAAERVSSKVKVTQERANKFLESNRKSQEPSPQLFLSRMNQELTNSLPPRTIRSLKDSGLLPEVQFGSWPLGPAVYMAEEIHGKEVVQFVRFNRLHKSVRWLLQARGEGRKQRAARLLLLLALLSLISENKGVRRYLVSDKRPPAVDRRQQLNLVISLLERSLKSFHPDGQSAPSN